MSIGQQIKYYRKKAGLTQEQVANHLGVSTPAVNKWEKGNTYPDISLLPALARLLKIDMNELFLFHEQLTDQEIGEFVNEVSEMALENFADAFVKAKKKIKEYPHCDLLIYLVSTVLNSALLLSDVNKESSEKYDTAIIEWLEQTSHSQNFKVKTSSVAMLATKYIQMERYDNAKNLLDQIPDNLIDTTIMKVNILSKQEGKEVAAYFLEGQLLNTIIHIQSYLYKLIELETATENQDKADEIAEIADHMVSLFGLWNYGKVVPHLLMAVYRQDVEKSIKMIKQVLEEAIKPWSMTESPLYYRFADQGKIKSFADTGDSFIRALINEIENQKEYEFLKGNKELEALFNSYSK